MLKNIRLGTRSSPLALKQAQIVSDLLSLRLSILKQNIEIVKISTAGDKFIDTKISDLGVKGVFTKELEVALLENKIDIAVHSLKDMPVDIHPELTISAVLPRDDARDVIVGFKGSIKDMPSGMRVGTSSLRREAQIKMQRPDINIVPVRGNIGTRMSKIGREVDAIILAKAGLDRIGDIPENSHILEFEEMIPAAAQGILAIQSRKDAGITNQMLQFLNHKETMFIAECERAFLKGWEDAKIRHTGKYSSSCRIPLGALARLVNNDKIIITAMVEDTGVIYYEKDIDSIDHRFNLGYRTAMNLAKIIFQYK